MNFYVIWYAAQRLVLPAVGRVQIKLREQDSVWVQKKPKNGAESYPSSAGFVGLKGLEDGIASRLKPAFLNLLKQIYTRSL